MRLVQVYAGRVRVWAKEPGTHFNHTVMIDLWWLLRVIYWVKNHTMIISFFVKPPISGEEHYIITSYFISVLQKVRWSSSQTKKKLRLTVSPILRPEQDLRPGMTSPFRQVALKDKDSSSGTPWSSSSTLERIFWQSIKASKEDMYISLQAS